MGRTSFLGPREQLSAFTFLGPVAILERLDEISKRLSISKHVLAALAIDSFLTQHYPSGGASQSEQELAGVLGEWATRVSPRGEVSEAGEGEHAYPHT